MTDYIDESPLKKLFPEDVVTVANRGQGDFEALYEAERSLVTRAVEKRKAEFAAGRLCARKALEVLGVDNFPIIIGEGRQPVWPQGVYGSISHARGFCGVAAFRSDRGGLIGLDIEESDRLKFDLWEMTFVEEELDWLMEYYGKTAEGVKWASVIFSAKEAFFKYQYPQTHAWVGFKDACVEVEESGKFVLKLLKDVSAQFKTGSTFEGKFTFFENYVGAGLCLLKGVN